MYQYFRFFFRNIARIGAITLCAMLFSTCKKEKDDTLSVTPQFLEFTADDTGEQSVTVESNTKWTHDNKDGWIEISKNDDGFVVTVKHYTNTTDPRNGVINVTAGKAKPMTVNVTQLAAVKNTLTVSPASLSFAANPTSPQTVSITTNASGWEPSAGAAGWLSLEKAGNTLMVSAGANTGTSQRSASITVNAGNADPATINVTQAGAVPDPNHLNVDQPQMNFLSAAGSKPLQITANVAWNITSDQSWCSVSTPTGNGNASVNVTVTANQGTQSRIAQLTVSNSQYALSKTVTVIQNGVEPLIIIDPVSKSIGAGAETINVTVSANVEFEVIPDVQWITVTQQTATAVTLQAQANPTTASRNGMVTFKQKGGNATATLTITQAGAAAPFINLSSTTESIGAEGKSFNITVTANVEYDITPDVNWITFTPPTTNTVTFQAQANTATASRTGTVTFKQKGGNATATLTVTQAGAQVLPDNVIFVSFAGNDDNDGKSWGKAMKSISAAIHVAPVGWQVWVEEGTYSGTIVLKDGVNVYGGFNRTESSIDDRETRKSTILGSFSMSDFTSPTIIDGFKITGFTSPATTIRRNVTFNNFEMSGTRQSSLSSTTKLFVNGGTVSNSLIEDIISISNDGRVLNSYINGDMYLILSGYGNAGDGFINLSGNARLEGCIIKNTYKWVVFHITF